MLRIRNRCLSASQYLGKTQCPVYSTAVGASHAILATRTTTALLDALGGSGDDPAWLQLDARYRPVIAGLARRLGASITDAEDIAQQTLAEFVTAYRQKRYDRTKGRLSSWILGIAHHTTLKLFRKNRRSGTHGEDVIEAASSMDDIEKVWRDERDRAILAQALGIIRDDSSVDDQTVKAFELVGLRGVPPARAATECGMTVDQVYVAKSRMTKRLRDLVKTLTDAFEEDE